MQNNWYSWYIIGIEWKVSTCRPAVSNETILATSQEFLFTKHNWHCIIGILIIVAILDVYITLRYYLFCKEFYFFECLYFSECDIQISLYVLWLKKGPSIK